MKLCKLFKLVFFMNTLQKIAISTYFMIWFRERSVNSIYYPWFRKGPKLISPLGRLREINNINLKRNFYNKTWSFDDVYTFLNEKKITMKYKV